MAVRLRREPTCCPARGLPRIAGLQRDQKKNTSTGANMRRVQRIDDPEHPDGATQLSRTRGWGPPISSFPLDTARERSSARAISLGVVALLSTPIGEADHAFCLMCEQLLRVQTRPPARENLALCGRRIRAIRESEAVLFFPASPYVPQKAVECLVIGTRIDPRNVIKLEAREGRRRKGRGGPIWVSVAALSALWPHRLQPSRGFASVVAFMAASEGSYRVA